MPWRQPWYATSAWICSWWRGYAWVWGAAAATVSAQALSALLCGGYLFRHYPQLRLTRQDLVFQRHLFRQSVQYGSVSALQESSLYCGKLLVQSAVNAMGPAAITAFTAASCIENLFLAFGNSGADALSVFVAQNQGARQPEQVREGCAGACGCCWSPVWH